MNPSAHQVTGEIVANGEVAAEHFLLSLELPLSFPEPTPGQFVMVRTSGGHDPMLGRPLGVYGFHRNPRHAVLDLLYRVCGKGTTLLSRLKHGDRLQILGPLGRGFDVAPGKKNIVLVAGGVGIVPLTYLAFHYSTPEKNAPGRKIVGYLGAQCCDKLVGHERLGMYCTDVKISTDDGSSGCCGLVTDMLREDLAAYRENDTAIYACGPTAMMRAVADILKDTDIPCQVSVEERMACGIGACLGCAVRIAGPGGGTVYKRACQEGPVFDIRDVVWDNGETDNGCGPAEGTATSGGDQGGRES